jgi:nucleoside-diphosphate-sugar epimerase
VTVSVRKRALVTGATGFIGSHLVTHLHRAGWKVAVIGHVRSLQKISLSAVGRMYEYTGQTAELISAVAEVKPTAVFHLASLFLAAHTSEQIEPLIRANILLGTQLLEAMNKGGCTVLVNAGTGWQNYVPEPPFDSPDFVPVNLYAATKQAFEDIAQYYVQTAGLRSITLRLFDSYGVGDTRRKLLPLLLDTLKTGRPLVMSPGDQVLDLVHVDDICRAFLRAAEFALKLSEPTAKVYAISGGQRRTLRQVAATLEEAAGCKLPLEFGKNPHRPREVMHPWDGPALPGWLPQITLLEGFRSLIAEEDAAATPE